jgi:hypothetical protein
MIDNNQKTIEDWEQEVLDAIRNSAPHAKICFDKRPSSEFPKGKVVRIVIETSKIIGKKEDD